MIAIRQATAQEPDSRGFELLDLSVTLGPGLVPWISAASRLGHVHGIPRLAPTIPAIADLLDSVHDFVDAVRFADRDTLSELKQALGQLAFGEPTVMELFQATRGVAAEHGRELLVRILASPHLAALPWELLPDPGRSHLDQEGAFLALAPDVSVVRLARGRTYPIRADRLEPPLNLLIVLSSPAGQDPADDSLSFDIYEERRALLAELQPLVDQGLLCIDVEDQPTLQNLRRRIGGQRRGYHLFHYLGHAEPDKLILEDEQGRREDQSAGLFMEVLRLCPDLRLAVFAGCETARAAGNPLTIDMAAAGDWRHILSLADRCVQESCPVVIGMQAVLSFRTERLFTQFFYQGLASGYSVTGAVRLARGATRGDPRVGRDLLDWSVPVVFVGGAEPGALLDRSAEGVPPRRPARHVLRYGLHQRETRFFARDIALRQAIDVLSGETPERVLVLTGPAAVGKTMLIDRALEEIAGPVSILYVRLEDLAPELAMGTTTEPPELEAWVSSIAGMPVEAPLQKLCRLVAELLTRDDGRRHDAEPGQASSEWWLRLIEELASRRLVLVIDNVDTLARTEAALTHPLVEHWLQHLIEQFRDDPGQRPLDELLGELVEEVGLNRRPGAPANPLLGGLHELREQLGGLTRTARDAVAASAEKFGPGSLAPRLTMEPASAARDEHHRTMLRAAIQRLADMRRSLDDALRLIADRRSGARLAIVADELPDRFLDVPTDQRFVMRLGRLTWFETWRWIRRNLPGLLRFGDAYLERLWPRLGANLELWEELERQVLRPGTAARGVPTIVGEIAPRQATGRNRLPGADLPRGERPLRVAVTGPYIASADALALAVTRLAADHRIGGRVVAGGEDESGSLAVLVDVPSPFHDGANTTENDIVDFLRKVSERKPDIVLLDYGYPVRLPLPDPGAHERPLLARLRHQALLIAAGGNRTETDGTATAPGVYPEVLSVGSVDSDGHLLPYSEWNPELSKPDIFMVDQLLGTALEGALSADARQDLGPPTGPGTRGSSFAALHAVGAAILAWSTLPDLSAHKLRALLRRAARPMDDASRPRLPMLTVEAAVTAARQEVIRQTVQKGACSLPALAAITGLEPRIISHDLHPLLATGEVRRLTSGRIERYEWVGA